MKLKRKKNTHQLNHRLKLISDIQIKMVLADRIWLLKQWLESVGTLNGTDRKAPTETKQKENE